MKYSRPNYGISRIDQPEKRNHGWFVRITLKGEVISKFFADKSHDGKSTALAAARRHRDALVKKLPKDRLDSLSRRRRHVKKSGFKGVTHVVTQDAAGHKYEYWQAAWREPRQPASLRQILHLHPRRKTSARPRQKTPRGTRPTARTEGHSHQAGAAGERVKGSFFVLRSSVIG